MKLKKRLALTLAGAVLTVSLTACTPLDAIELMTGFSAAGAAMLPAVTARALRSRRRSKRASSSGLDFPAPKGKRTRQSRCFRKWQSALTRRAGTPTAS